MRIELVVPSLPPLQRWVPLQRLPLAHCWLCLFAQLVVRKVSSVLTLWASRIRSGGDPESTSAYGVPQVPSKMTKHKKSEQVSPDDVPIVNKSALPRFDIVPFRHDGESINSCMSTVNSTVRASEALPTRKVRENF